MKTTMSLDAFVAFIPILLDAFVNATREHGKTDASFNCEREVDDWCRELAAYVEYTDLQEELARSVS